MRFLVDENIAGSIATLLASEGHEVIDVADSALHRSSDDALSEFAAEGRWIIVTRDKDFPVQGAPVPLGLILLRLPRGFRGPRFVQMFREFMQTEEFKLVEDRITIVEPGRKPRQRRFDDG